MSERIERQDLIRLVASHTRRDTTTVEEVLDAALEEIYAALKRGESVSLRNFGMFYVRPESA